MFSTPRSKLTPRRPLVEVFVFVVSIGLHQSPLPHFWELAGTAQNFLRRHSTRVKRKAQPLINREGAYTSQRKLHHRRRPEEGGDGDVRVQDLSPEVLHLPGSGGPPDQSPAAAESSGCVSPPLPEVGEGPRMHRLRPRVRRRPGSRRAHETAQGGGGGGGNLAAGGIAGQPLLPLGLESSAHGGRG